MAQNTYLGAHWCSHRRWRGVLSSGFSFLVSGMSKQSPRTSSVRKLASFDIRSIPKKPPRHPSHAAAAGKTLLERK
jgi:hypothetical protein